MAARMDVELFFTADAVSHTIEVLVRFQWNRTVAHHPSHARPSAIIQPRGQMLALNAHFVISSAAPTALILRFREHKFH